MSQRMDGELEWEVEPERYELDERPAYQFLVDRREFWKALGGGLVILLLAESAAAQEPRGRRGRRGQGSGPSEISAWLHINEDGRITVYTGKVEVGQNIRTSLTQVVAEELGVAVDAIDLVMGDTERTPPDAGTFGSRTTPAMAPQLRRAAAAAREALIDLAAKDAGADRVEFACEAGKIVHRPTGKEWTFAQLTQGQQLAQTIAPDVPTSPPQKWTVAGKSIPKVNGRAMVTGKHRYASDIRLPGMLHGKILRPPAYGARMTSGTTREAEALPDVIVVRDGDFVGVAAPTEWQATQALEMITAEWDVAPQISSAQLFQHLKETARDGQVGRGGVQVGSIKQGLADADHRLSATYTVAYIAHAPLEPRAAVAQWEDGKLTVWTGTQRPFGVQRDLAQAFQLSPDQVRVIVPDTGSGYGGKHTGEAALEAARLARSAGRPVKLVWTREEEFTWAYFRPAGVIDVSSGVRRDGTLTAWEFHNFNSGGSAIRTLYEVPHQLIQFHSADSPLRQGSYRALAATANHFARETHMDEIAHTVGMDPLELRLKNLQDERLQAVLRAAAEAFGWSQPEPERHGFGLAGGFEKGSYVATCAEVSLNPTSGHVEVLRAVTAFECGAILNPDHLKNQIEGAMVMGLGGALTEAIEFEGGKILNGRFLKYRVPRFRDTPEIEMVLLDRKDLPSAGAGETPIVAIAPAVGNAIFAATGVRLRSLPMAPDGVIEV